MSWHVLRDLVAYVHNEEPEYLHQSSDRFKIEIKRERDFQRNTDQRFGISLDYVESKLRECTLIYQDKYKAREETEVQRQQTEQMREEREAQREYDAALKKAQEEEQAFQQMLEKAREALSGRTKEQVL